MATNYLKSLTIDGVTDELVFPETQTKAVTFTITSPDTAYGGAKVTLEAGFVYFVQASCIFGNATSTAGNAYLVWLANASTPMNPWAGDQIIYNPYNTAPRLSACSIVRIPEELGDTEVGAYANIRAAALGGNTIIISATKIGKCLA